MGNDLLRVGLEGDTTNRNTEGIKSYKGGDGVGEGGEAQVYQCFQQLG